MLAGKAAVRPSTFQALVTAHLTEPPPPLSEVATDVPPVIGTVIEKALANCRRPVSHRGGIPRRARSANDGAFQRFRRRRRLPRAVVFGYRRSGRRGCRGRYVLTRPPNWIRTISSSCRSTCRTRTRRCVRHGGFGCSRSPEVGSRRCRPVVICATGSNRDADEEAQPPCQRMGAGLAVSEPSRDEGRLTCPHASSSTGARRETRCHLPATGPANELPRLVDDLIKDLRGELNKLRARSRLFARRG
jgi:hypothetical protein